MWWCRGGASLFVSKSKAASPRWSCISRFMSRQRALTKGKRRGVQSFVSCPWHPYHVLPAFQEPSGEPVPKRPRGRPKGSKNKGPSKAAQKVRSHPLTHTRCKCSSLSGTSFTLNVCYMLVEWVINLHCFHFCLALCMSCKPHLNLTHTPQNTHTHSHTHWITPSVLHWLLKSVCSVIDWCCECRSVWVLS